MGFYAKHDYTVVHNLFYQPLNRQIIKSEFSLTWSCVSLTRSTYSSEWKLFRFDIMEVKKFQTLPNNVTFYFISGLKAYNM